MTDLRHAISANLMKSTCTIVSRNKASPPSPFEWHVPGGATPLPLADRQRVRAGRAVVVAPHRDHVVRVRLERVREQGVEVPRGAVVVLVEYREAGAARRIRVEAQQSQVAVQVGAHVERDIRGARDLDDVDLVITLGAWTGGGGIAVRSDDVPGLGVAHRGVAAHAILGHERLRQVRIVEATGAGPGAVLAAPQPDDHERRHRRDGRAEATRTLMHRIHIPSSGYETTGCDTSAPSTITHRKRALATPRISPHDPW